ncbi:hypothetical protein D3C87_253940 [compost metagenome]
MKKLLLLISLPLLLSSCASIKKAICDCQKPATTDELTLDEDFETTKSVKLVKRKKSPTQETIVVDKEDVQLADKMTKAVDKFVFKDEEKDFETLCRGTRFDCWVDEKPYPKGKKAIARTIPPFLSGSKMGLRGDKRIQVRFTFYP